MRVLFFGFLAVLLFAHCEMSEQNCIEGQGDVQEQQFDPGSFSGLILNISADVKLSQGSQSVTISAPANYFEEMEMNVRRNKLTIESKRCFKDKIEATISLPNIDYLEISGSGNITTSEFSAEELELLINGSGNMDVSAKVAELTAAINGSGDIKLKGNAQALELGIAGSGSFNAFETEVLDADVQIAGSGDANLNIYNELEVEIAGSGDVMYKGHPKISSTIVGSGDIVDSN